MGLGSDGSPPEQSIEHALHRMPMVRGSGAHATDRPILAPLFLKVSSAEQPAAHAALPSVHREERSSTRGACERQAHDLIVAQSGQGCALLREESAGQNLGPRSRK